MRENRLNRLMNGALILSVAGLFSKILSAVYRIPFQNLVGDTGFYIYQQVYPIYGIGMVLALSGLPVYISKLIAAAEGDAMKRRVARRSIALLTMIGVAAFALTFFGAHGIARAMSDTQLTPLIQCVAFMFLLLPIVGGARAYFQGIGNMVPTAQSQVAEQLVRVAIIIAAAVVGRTQHWSLYLTGTVAMGGAIVGGAVTAIILAPKLYQQLRGRVLPHAKGLAGVTFTRRFVLDGGAFVLFSALIILLQMVDSFTMTRAMTTGGMATAAARAAKGVYDRGQPFVQLGLVVATALGQTLLPSLASSHEEGRLDRFLKVAVMLMHMSLISGVIASVGLVVMMPRANMLLFGDRAGSGTLALYVCAIAIMAILNAGVSLLQSQNRFRIPLIGLGFGLVVKLVLNLLLVPGMKTAGAALATNFALLTALFVVYRALPLAIRDSMWHNHFGRKTVVMVIVVAIVGSLANLIVPLGGRMHALVACAVIGVAMLGAAVIVATRSRLLTVREVLTLPGGKWFLKQYTKLFNKEK
ncbi:polysaccharide biosynthesis protein [Lacticaseibacillus pabuli]|uniref:Polysaccharide biosynthesis protein n=1 Tax=Lacticaseibacillus pabuli TaxID=3025672 RepID=A0ABY7WTH7_9LACO|nr:polysaccharide biosynthesis protein [Lacticaseibacillus sp. KACC 23028]WDF83051.1 polysaccharide biosynthesis protein [Lacticaseibacillus sp. KACC 23028]